MMTPLLPAVRAAFLLGQPYAHRGLHNRKIVENSRAAFEAAIARGHGIELDVRLSRDGEAMVFHDAVLDRLTEEQGAVDARPFAELSRIPLARCGRGETIPSLREVLELIDGRVPVLVEVKAPMFLPGGVCWAVRNAIRGCERWVAVMSFSPRAVKWFARHAPEVTRGLVFSATERDRRLSWAPASSLLRYAISAGQPDFVACDCRDIAAPWVQRWRRSMPFLSWTVRDEATRTGVASWTDGIIYEDEA